MQTKTSNKETTKKKSSSFGLALLAFIIGFVGSFGGIFYVEMPADDGENIVVSGALSIHFLELGNNNTGDSVYIKAGENDILIDAGSRANSAPVIQSYVDTYCTDGTLEYVVATHAHQDHIAGFAGSSKYQSIFEMYECKTIIDFAQTNSTSSVYTNYCTKRDAEIALGANHYTAADCVDGTNGGQSVYNLGDGLTMTVLEQKFYHETSTDENNYSVCLLFTHGSHYFLLTGDLEKDGEESLAELNELPHVDLFKAGHHGSYTASNNVLLQEIQPQIVCVCCCAGAVEYTQTKENTFPSQAFINRIALYTTNVYVTTVGTVEFSQEKNKYVDTGFASLNGTIIVTSDTSGVGVKCSNSDAKLKDTDWFKNNRTCPSQWQ